MCDLGRYFGKKFGRLTVICPSRKKSHVVCRCECGNFKDVSIYNLLAGNTKSCGCLRRDNTSKNFSKFRKVNGEYRTNYFNISAVKPRVDNTSGYTGVSYRNNIGKYEAYITLHRHKHYLGIYNSIHDAVEAREKARVEMFDPVIEEMKKELA